ncbi:hypothetical protein KGF54_003862 [Candida jiufengensis]|uniref:uncharacterized protein n=1 Tax=Candida jiufengensis TaxID=497108 RepID=UPI0022242EDE|nr:uncharacterized protein KGF54_003862 [Candida jiufengensis]KAI5950788.1 hypothetical protein KGF54_003862 [Candida jiufengensis]
MTNDVTSNKFEYIINRPIGYSKSPLNQHQRQLSISNTLQPNLIENNKQLNPQHTNRESTTTPFKLNDLPVEIISTIINNLSQFDILNLIRTCSKLYNLGLPILYQYIVIDSNFNIFNNNEYKTNGITYINSSFNLKKFLKTYNNKIESSSHLIKIYKFKCLSLPDSISLYDDKFNLELIKFFSKLYYLNSLIWINYNFRLEFLYNLPNTELINTLILNIRFIDYLSNDQDNWLEDFNYEKYYFPNLTNFQIKHFENASNIIKIINNLLINENNPVEACNRLQNLSLSARCNPNDFIFGDNFDEQTNHNNHFFKSMFIKSKLKYLENLTSLSLNDMIVSNDDADLLINSVNLKNLKILQLRGIEEINNNSNQSLTYLSNNSFLLKILPYLTNIVHLALEIFEVKNTLPNFLIELSNINTHIRSLDLSTYLQFNLSNSISCLINLDKLSLEVYDPIDDLSCEDLSIEFYNQISNLNLKTLRINNSSNIQGLINLITSQLQLEYLDIIGSKAGGAPNLGLGMVHPTIFDDWFKVQHVALFYLKLNSNLKYISINECLFQCKKNLIINPIDGLNYWFNEKVRCRGLLEVDD